MKLNRAQGKWQLVRELLGLKGTFLKPRWQHFAKTVSSRDFFGNWLPLMLEIERYLYSKKMYPDSYLSWDDHSSYRVRKKVYRRGYDDKGSRRPEQKWFPENAFSRNCLMKFRSNVLFTSRSNYITVTLKNEGGDRL